MEDLLKHNRTEIQHMMVQSGSAVLFCNGTQTA
ncbi:hypothetical protein PI125_g16469 [Phytophthora idaei]|nr:hypothetical protein PI125_g16469 [Phytophthora idaei]